MTHFVFHTYDFLFGVSIGIPAGYVFAVITRYWGSIRYTLLMDDIAKHSDLTKDITDNGPQFRA